jgi:hypothetical protein
VGHRPRLVGLVGHKPQNAIRTAEVTAGGAAAAGLVGWPDE